MLAPPLRTILILLCSCLLAFGGDVPKGYEAREGDLLFQSLPHCPLVDAIEGMTESPFSHCGIVTRKGGEWQVIEAIGPVKETALVDWIEQGRDNQFTVYRLMPKFEAKVPEIIAAARTFLGRPYDIHYKFDDEKIYCSELIYKAVEKGTGVRLGKIQKLGDLKWKGYVGLILAIEGSIPLGREMITPRALTEAGEVKKVFQTGP